MRMSRRASVLGASNKAVLSALAVGTEVQINESGVAVPYLIIAQGYVSGKTMLLRKRLSLQGGSNFPWPDELYQCYDTCPYDVWMNGTFYNALDSNVRTNIPSVSVQYYYPGYGVQNYSKKVFALSVTQMNTSATNLYSGENTAISYFDSNAKRVAKNDADTSTWEYWVRTTNSTGGSGQGIIGSDGVARCGSPNSTAFVRPAFHLPNTMLAYGSNHLIK